MTTFGLAWAQARAGRPARARQAHTPLLMILVAWLGRTLPTVARARTAIMQITAFGFIDYAVFEYVGRGWGFAAVGVTLLIVETLLSMDPGKQARR